MSFLYVIFLCIVSDAFLFPSPFSNIIHHKKSYNFSNIIHNKKVLISNIIHNKKVLISNIIHNKKKKYQFL